MTTESIDPASTGPLPSGPWFRALVSSGMSAEQALRWTADTERLRASCGCETGAWSMGLMLVAWPAAWYWRFRPQFAWPWALVAWPVAVFIAAGVGKVAGLWTARLRLGMRLRRLNRALNGGVANA